MAAARLCFSACMMSITLAGSAVGRRHHFLALDLGVDQRLQIVEIRVVILLRLKGRRQRLHQHLRQLQFLLFHQAGVGAKFFHAPYFVGVIHGVHQTGRERPAGR